MHWALWPPFNIKLKTWPSFKHTVLPLYATELQIGLNLSAHLSTGLVPEYLAFLPNQTHNNQNKDITQSA